MSSVHIDCYVANQAEIDAWAPIIEECKAVSQEDRESLPVNGEVVTDEMIMSWMPEPDLWVKLDDGNDSINIPLYLAKLVAAVITEITCAGDTEVEGVE